MVMADVLGVGPCVLCFPLRVIRERVPPARWHPVAGKHPGEVRLPGERADRRSPGRSPPHGLFFGMPLLLGDLPQGFAYHPAVLDETEERELAARLAGLDFAAV